MFNGRMLNIIRYLKSHGQSSYKEVARDLNISERSVRYDVDRINDILSLERLPEIEKHSKGVLVYPEHLDLKGMEDGNEVIYTGKERMSILLLILMIRNEDLKINQLSEQFRVSRSTVKNDMAALDEELKKDGMGIGYSGHFYLAGPKIKRATLLNQEFRKYIEYLINPFTSYNSYEFYCIHIIHKAFEGVSVANVVMAVDDLLEELQCTLTSSSYLWYMSNVVVLVWYILHGKVYPLDITVAPDFNREAFGRFGKRLEEIIGREVSEEHIRMMAKMFDFTNKIAGGNADVDPVQAEAVTFSLISAMSKRLNMPFDKDRTLVEGLLNHMIPLIQRINNHVSIRDNMISLLRPQDRQMYNLMAQVCAETDILDRLPDRMLHGQPKADEERALQAGASGLRPRLRHHHHAEGVPAQRVSDPYTGHHSHLQGLLLPGLGVHRLCALHHQAEQQPAQALSGGEPHPAARGPGRHRPAGRSAQDNSIQLLRH